MEGEARLQVRATGGALSLRFSCLPLLSDPLDSSRRPWVPAVSVLFSGVGSLFTKKHSVL